MHAPPANKALKAALAHQQKQQQLSGNEKSDCIDKLTATAGSLRCVTAAYE